MIQDQNQFEEIRRQYIQHEASVKSVGSLYWLGGIFVLFAAVGSGIAAVSTGSAPEIMTAVMFLGIAFLQFFVGSGLRKLKSWSRIPTAILSGLGLLAFPLGTLINGYILYLVCGRKGSYVFTPSYAEIIQATPHVKYKTSKVVWALLILILVFIAALVLYALSQ